MLFYCCGVWQHILESLFQFLSVPSYTNQNQSGFFLEFLSQASLDCADTFTSLSIMVLSFFSQNDF